MAAATRARAPRAIPVSARIRSGLWEKLITPSRPRFTGFLSVYFELPAARACRSYGSRPGDGRSTSSGRARTDSARERVECVERAPGDHTEITGVEGDVN